jgi:hypothetical protein
MTLGINHLKLYLERMRVDSSLGRVALSRFWVLFRLATGLDRRIAERLRK